nr:cupin domain-containing protein [Burkholderia ambifaria]
MGADATSSPPHALSSGAAATAGAAARNFLREEADGFRFIRNTERCEQRRQQVAALQIVGSREMTIGHVARLGDGRQDRRADRIAARCRSTMLDRSGRLLNCGEPVDRMQAIVAPFHRRSDTFRPWRANAAVVSPLASKRFACIVAHCTAISGFRVTMAQRTFPRPDPEHTTMKLGLNASLARLDAEGTLFTTLFRHGTLDIELYRPRGEDLQTPHTRDEVYVIAAGTSRFVLDGRECGVAAGDVLFVPAFAAHRFAGFSDDFSTWVFFHGPEGGESGERST